MRRPKIIEMRMERDAISRLAYFFVIDDMVCFKMLLESFKKETGKDLTKNPEVEKMIRFMTRKRPWLQLLPQEDERTSKQRAENISEKELERLIKQQEIHMEKDAISRLTYHCVIDDMVGFKMILESFKKETGKDLTKNPEVEKMIRFMIGKRPWLQLLPQEDENVSKQNEKNISENGLERLIDQLVDFCENDDEVGFQSALDSIKESTGIDLSTNPEVKHMISIMSGNSTKTDEPKTMPKPSSNRVVIC